ncbi:proline-rich transmembrane protein 1-like [Saccostrea cucullata]|uniref:proline-rich transmembrane protein 1-like n=1 Tax=Saccostrea cuccullata TaxID=36930 RepID=UPI002ED4F3E3
MQSQQYSSQYNHNQSYGGNSQSVIVTQPTPGVVPVVPQSQYRDWMIISILVLVFCFWPTGIPAVIYSKKTNNAIRDGDWAHVSIYTKHAKTFVIISLIVGISLIVISIVVRVVLTILFSS